jgi:hypothetical protein
VGYSKKCPSWAAGLRTCQQPKSQSSQPVPTSAVTLFALTLIGSWRSYSCLTTVEQTDSRVIPFTAKMTDQSPIEVVTQLEQRDVARANIDIALGRFTPYKWVVLGISSGVLSAMFVVVIFPQIAKSPDRWLEILLVGLIGLLGWPAILVGAIHLNSRKAAKSLLRSAPARQGPTHWLFSDSEVQMIAPTGSSNIEWKAFIRVRETGLQFLLYPQDQIAYVIPKRSFSTKEQISRFKELIRREAPVPGAAVERETDFAVNPITDAGRPEVNDQVFCAYEGRFELVHPDVAWGKALDIQPHVNATLAQ